jgi:hypothetical protein
MDTNIVEMNGQHSSPKQRKAELIRQGELYRSGVMHAKAQVKYAARPESLFHSAIDHASRAVRLRVDALLKPSGSSVAMIMPYAMTIFRFIRQRRMGKAGLGAGVVLALAAAGWYLQQRRAAHAGH